MCYNILRRVKRPKNFIIFLSTVWRSRLAWSRAHDWKSCRRQKRLEGSNPSSSAQYRLIIQTVFLFLENNQKVLKFAAAGASPRNAGENQSMRGIVGHPPLKWGGGERRGMPGGIYGTPGWNCRGRCPHRPVTMDGVRTETGLGEEGPVTAAGFWFLYTLLCMKKRAFADIICKSPVLYGVIRGWRLRRLRTGLRRA